MNSDVRLRCNPSDYDGCTVPLVFALFCQTGPDNPDGWLHLHYCA